MKERKCNFCNEKINEEDGISVCGYDYDLCDRCEKIARQAVCRSCNGRGMTQVRDDDATDAQATCGESRTVYKSIECKSCK